MVQSDAWGKLLELADHNGETDDISCIAAYVISSNQSTRQSHDAIKVEQTIDLICELNDHEWDFLHAGLTRTVDWYTSSLKLQLYKYNWIAHLDTMRAFRE